MPEVRTRVKLFVAAVSAFGLACIGTGMVPWRHTDFVQFACYLVLTAVASGLKVVFPGFSATFSVNVILFVVSIGSLSISETLALGVTAAIVQCFWKNAKRLGWVHFMFNLSQISIALTGAYWVHALLVRGVLHGRALIALLVSAIVFFVINSALLATVVSLAERKATVKSWKEYAWTFPFYLVGAAIAGFIQLMNGFAGWEISVLVMPALYVIYRSYSIHIGRLEDMQDHLQEMASLHLRTVEALALAIDAKDHTTGDHVHRVRIYAMELAKDLDLSLAETDALRAAAVLHDIGKLAVPEHIISKPGKLTPEEFEKMKVHPIVGAEILGQVEFPYPVVPIVRSHHERWDGSGYPDGLRGEEIPIGARILSAVDCLDALASDRQYRRALPLDEAMARVELESGRTFDPVVVAKLKSRYMELERLARAETVMEKPQLSVNVKVAPGAAPAAGYAAAEASVPEKSGPEGDARPALAALGGIANAALPTELDEMLPVLAMRLRNRIAFDSIAIFVSCGDRLMPRLALGEDCGKLWRLTPTAGEGLLGWVAHTRRAIRNGNPGVDLAPTNLRSALAVPLENSGELVGVIALYHLNADAFTAEHLGVIDTQRDEIAKVLQSALLTHVKANANTQQGPLKQGDRRTVHV